MREALYIAIFFACYAAGMAASEASDPAGTWSKCANQVGDTIIVEGPRCPAGWRKIY